MGSRLQARRRSVCVNFLAESAASYGYRGCSKQAQFEKLEESVIADAAAKDTTGREQPHISADRYASLLQRCGNAKALPQGKRVHALVIDDGQDSDRLLCNLVVRMYGKCGSVEDAHASFALMRDRNVFSWAIMISMYVEHGYIIDALFAVQQMLSEGVLPDKAVFVAILSACASSETLLEGRRMHACIIACCFLPDMVVGTALVTMYGKCKRLDYAQIIFNDMPRRNVVSWNAMIAVHAEHRLDMDVHGLLTQMQVESVLPDEVTFVAILDACANQGALTNGRKTHALCLNSGLDSDVVVGTALVNMYGKCGDSEEASKVFQKLVVQDVVSWSAMIAAHSQHGNSEDAVQLFQQMQLEGVVPNLITVVSVLDSCAVLDEGKRIHAYIVGCRFASDMAVGNALLKMYGNCGDLLSVRKLLDQLMQRNVVSWTEMIKVCLEQGQGKDAIKHYGQMLMECVIPDNIAAVGMLDACSSQEALSQGKQMHSCIVGNANEIDTAVCIALVNFYGKCCCLDEARRILFEMSKQDVVTWSSLIKAYAEHRQVKEAFQLFEEMEGVGVMPDRVCLISILDICACHAALCEGKQMHNRIADMGLELDLVVGTALVTMYSKCGSLEDAERTFDRMPEQNAVSWNAIIGAHAQHGQVKQSLNLFQQMQLGGFAPDSVTFHIILSACRYAGLLDEGCRFFLSMCQDHDFRPTVDHFNCMVDLVARAGLLDEGEGLIKSMPFNPNGTSWMTLLGACNKHLDVNRGTYAAEHVFKLDSRYASPYVLLSNIYAAAHMWDNVVKVRKSLEERHVMQHLDESFVEKHEL